MAIQGNGKSRARAKSKSNQGKSKSRQIKANQGNSRQNKRGDILPVIMLFFKSSHQFLYRSQDIRTNVSITLFLFFIKF